MMQIQRLRFTEAIYEHFLKPQNFVPLRICYGSESIFSFVLWSDLVLMGKWIFGDIKNILTKSQSVKRWRKLRKLLEALSENHFVTNSSSTQREVVTQISLSSLKEMEYIS
ncbi:hypothetical protein H8S90_18835 [Olivibacter sp. SDN3]|uniref:hypothetical protein n=1 Tax=Olivibacter sp. SDN3 TaxID=2764720 RepID=UPI001650DE27|nr:hypothetical protein [Olivibacter sp. SDN3]QNL48805.1 hypothetical protein H8S90_18835 [Olivibacter sp. SDN3]